MTRPASEVSRGVGSVVGEAPESEGRKGDWDRRGQVVTHEDDDGVVEWAMGISQHVRKPGRRVSDVDVVLVALDDEEQDERGASGLCRYTIPAVRLVGSRCAAQSAFQHDVVRHRLGPPSRSGQVVGHVGGGYCRRTVLKDRGT